MVHESNEKTTRARLRSRFLEYNGFIMGFSVNSLTKVARMQHIQTNRHNEIKQETIKLCFYL